MKVAFTPQFKLEDLYITPFTGKRYFDPQTGKAYYKPVERNMTPTGVDMLDKFLQCVCTSKCYTLRSLQEQIGVSKQIFSGLCFPLTGLKFEELHEAIRQYSVAAAQEIKMYGRPNNLLDQIRKDPLFDLTEEELQTLIDPSTFTGMSAQQTEKYLADVVRPVLEQHRDELGAKVEIKV